MSAQSLKQCRKCRLLVTAEVSRCECGFSFVNNSNSEETFAPARRVVFCKFVAAIGSIVSIADLSQRFGHVGHDSAAISPAQIIFRVIGYGLWPMAVVSVSLVVYMLLELLLNRRWKREAYLPISLLLPILAYSALVLILHMTELY